MLLIVGLGNPGRRYAAHRHNLGFMVVERLAAEWGTSAFVDKFAGELARARLRDDEVLLLKPQTYMNDSGRSVQPAAAFYKVPVDQIVVIHDDLDLPFGDVRLKRGGGHGGHNGLRSMIQHLGSADFCRMRLGIGRDPEFVGDIADYVLAPLPEAQREVLPRFLKTACRSVLEIATRGFDAAMKSSNTRQKKSPKPPTPPAIAAAVGGAPTQNFKTPEASNESTVRQEKLAKSDS